MSKFSKTFRGVPNGEIYPRIFNKGDDCPPELEDAAREEGALVSEKKKGKPAPKGATPAAAPAPAPAPAPAGDAKGDESKGAPAPAPSAGGE